MCVVNSKIHIKQNYVIEVAMKNARRLPVPTSLVNVNLVQFSHGPEMVYRQERSYHSYSEKTR